MSGTYRGSIPLMVGMEDTGSTIQMDEEGRGRVASLGSEPEEAQGGVPKASLTGPSSVAHQRLVEAARAHQERKSRDPRPRQEPAPWLTQYMEDEGMIEDHRFQSAFDTGGPDIAVRDSMERSNAPMPTFDDEEYGSGR